MSSTFSSRRLRRFLPRSGTQLARQQEELEARLQTAVESAENKDAEDDEGSTDDDGGSTEDVLDIGDGIDGGDAGSIAEGDTDVLVGDTEDDDTEEDEEIEDPIVGDGLVEEVAMELEGSRTRQGHRYDGGGALVTVSYAHSRRDR